MQKPSRVTIKDVALRAGTSAATVSYVLNDVKGRYISPEMRKNVEDAAREMGYVKSLAASRLKGKKMGVVAFLTPQFDNEFFLDIFFAIEQIASQKGYILSVCNTFDDPNYEKTVIQRMNQLWIDACWVIPTHAGMENITYLKDHGIPFVSIERPLVGLDDYDFISSDNFDAAYQMTKHLIEKGHKRIALAYWETRISNLDERLLGYKKALEDHNIPFDELLVKRTENIDLSDGARITEEILAEKSATAIFYSQYVLAEGGVKYLREQNISIPDDISIAVMGGPKWVELSDVKFTHILQPGTAIGERVAEIMFDKLEGNETVYVQEKLLCKLSEGNSVKDLTAVR